MPSISCQGCVDSLRKALTSEGAEAVSGDPEKKTIRVRFDERHLDEGRIREAILTAGHVVGE
ncbi:MAG: heavy-metal-associated domain-containing protein [Nitrospinota bacterium]